MLQIDLKYILLIEVDRDIREIIRRSLGNTATWQVMSANSVAQEFALIQAHKPDVILLEASLLDQCQPHIWQQLQTNASNQCIPIVFMAARIRPMDRLQFKQLGAAEAIAKPFDPQDLVKAVAQLLK